MDAAEPTMGVDEAADVVDTVLSDVGDAVIADREFFEDIMLGVLARGHVLLEDVPGTGKTLTARSVADALGLSFSRVQFTPDLLPADVTGTHVFNEGTREFEFNEGPIFANVVLADEINRAPPKTQAALLEAMEEEQVTTDGETRQLPDPFVVIATQNPVEQEGSLHPDETLYMDGELWTAGDALAHAREHGDLIHDAETKVYDAGTTTQTLDDEGELVERPCYVYETEYDGRLYTVETRSGRRIEVSGNHPFLVNRAGTLQWVEARNLRDDDFLAAPDRLPVNDRSFPGHDAALESLAENRGWTVVPSDRAERLRTTLADDGDPSRDEVDDLRIAAGLSKTALADRVEASYDRVLNFLDGASTGLGSELANAIDPGEVVVADHVETHRIHRFDAELTPSEAGFFVGFVLSDGHVSESSVEVHQTNYPRLFDRWVDLAEKLGFDPRVREKDGCRGATVDSKPLVEYLDARYDLRSPERLVSAPEQFRAAFLEVFVLAEGHFDAERRRITVTQADRKTTNLLAHLLLSFDIRPWVKDRDRVYRIKIQGEDVATYCERFRWPGESPAIDEFESSHRVTPVAEDDVQAVVERLGLNYDGLSDREWYNSLRSGRDRMADDALAAFLDDAAVELSDRRATDPATLARQDLETVAKGCGLALTDIVEATDASKHQVWRAYQGADPPAVAVEYVAGAHAERVDEAARLVDRLRALADSDVFFDRIRSVESEPYEGPVVGLSVPGTHNYPAGLGACGINHNTFPLPEAQVDRFMVKTSIGYPDEDGEVELLRRRSGRTEQSPSVDPLLDAERVSALQRVPETVRVDEDLLSYMAAVARGTREDRRVDVGVSPRGTQRLFETARARAVLHGREFVTPDDVKAIADVVLAHRLVLTPDATVNNVDKSEVVADVLESVPVPTVE
jgi:MoxR-like ATPase/intein/homing endonuclease